MGSYNLLEVELDCPRCRERVTCEVEFTIGLLNLHTYRLGEHLQWAGGYRNKPLQRPEKGNATGEGYTVCPACDQDFWVKIDVDGDKIAAADPNPHRPGYLT